MIPGYVSTNLSGLDSQTVDTVLETGAEGVIEDPYPLEAVTSAEEYASYYVFLASESDTSATTGEVTTADAGLGIRGIKLSRSDGTSSPAELLFWDLQVIVEK